MGNSTSAALPFIIHNDIIISDDTNKTGWIQYTGTRKSDSLPVSVFSASKAKLLSTPLPNPSGGFGNSHGGITSAGKITSPVLQGIDPNCQLPPAYHHFQKLKTLIHPHILRAHATLDTDDPGGGMNSNAPPAAKFGTSGDFLIVTESVIPLPQYLDRLPSNAKDNAQSVGWGLYCIIQSLHFLHGTAKCAHGNVSPESIYVTPGGDWKLGNFALLTPIGPNTGPDEHFCYYDSKLCPQGYRSPERAEGRYDALSNSAPHVMDSYGLGKLIEHVYQHPGVGGSGKVPQKLVKATQRLQTLNLKARPRCGPLLKCPVFDVEYVKTMTFLDTMSTQAYEDRMMFYQRHSTLTTSSMPEFVARHKLLPALLHQLSTCSATPAAVSQEMNRREVMAILPPLFTVSESYPGVTPAEFAVLFVKPHLATLFKIADRGIRGALLSNIHILETLVDDNSSLNTTIFEPMCTGFTDSAAPLRELTLKSALVLVPRLNNVNREKLVRYLVRLQSDDESSIRTNAVIFISKVAPSLGATSRSKLILPAFSRAMSDAFVPCRMAALRSVLECRVFYSREEIAKRVLPVLVPHIVDEDAGVKNETLRVVEQLIDVIKNEHQGQGGGGDDGHGPGVGKSDSSGSLSQGYMTGLKSFMWSSSITDTNANSAGSVRVPADNDADAKSGVASVPHTQTHTSSNNNTSSYTPQTQTQQHQQYQPTAEPVDDGWNDDADDGWGDLDDAMPKPKPKPKPTHTHGHVLPSSNQNNAQSSWNDDDTDPDPFAHIGKAKPKQKLTTAATNVTTQKKLLITPKLPTGPKLSLADRKAEFEKRRLQREKERSQGTPVVKIATKLGPSSGGGGADGWDDF